MSKNKKNKVLDVVNSNFYLALGCLPVIILSSICFYLLYGDYERNNFSFMGKSRFYSNSNPNDYIENSSQIGEFSCARYFTDYVLSENEVTTLLKFSETIFDKNDKAYLNDLKNNKEFKNVYK